MKYDVVALGELLIDFTDSGVSEQGNPLFEANPGGAPCNVLAMSAKLGKKTAFIGKVGRDLFGERLRKALEHAGIDAENLIEDKAANTTLAFVQNKPDGDRDFLFYRKGGADTMLRPDEVKTDVAGNCRIFHCGTLSLTDEPSASATEYAVSLAKKNGALISFDPNLRLSLWRGSEQAKNAMCRGLSRCDILKMSEVELFFLYDCGVVAEAVRNLRRDFPNIRVVFVTKGKDGSECFFGKSHVAAETLPNVKSVDATGAGDTFFGCCLARLSETGIDVLDERRICEILRFANAAAALITTRKGALGAMPSTEDVLSLINL